MLSYVFALVTHEGVELKSLPLTRRKGLLQPLVPAKQDIVRFSASISGDPKQLLAQACRHKLEGIIAKQAASEYEPGRRADAWLKIKCLNGQEFVIGGDSAPPGGGRVLAALLLRCHARGKTMSSSYAATAVNH